jgi:hypothetical protein
MIQAADLHDEMEVMTGNLATANERRESHRFIVNAPVILDAGEHKIPAYTRDLSNRGVYFYLTLADSLLIDGDFDFSVDLPPEITLSSCCSILCRGRMVRVEDALNDLKGMAAQILQYSISREAGKGN